MAEEEFKDEMERTEGNSVVGDLNDVLEAVDEFEDQIEGVAYEELVPLHVKFALEEKVFGWSNLSASIFGHVAITGGAYALAYFGLSIIPFYIRDEATTHTTKVLISLWGAVSAFRMVRRRRYVWLRNVYGSKEYRKDEQRRQMMVRETDSTTILGRIRRKRNVYLRSRVQRKLDRAEQSFVSYKEKKSTRLKSTRRPSFHTFPAKETKSIENDQVLFAHGPIKNIPYSHGCFFGAAPFMLANPYWISILRRLLPDVYVEISRRVEHAPARRLIHWAENNPVVAAYGIAHELENNGKLVNLEWDVFLDPRLVKRIELVLEQRENFLISHGDKPESWTVDEKNIKKFLEAELNRRSAKLLDTMLIAHGNLTQLLLEQTGYGKEYVFSRVRHTQRTLGGGMYARQWMAVYAEALRLGTIMKEQVSNGAESSSGQESCSSESDTDEGSVILSEISEESKLLNTKDLALSSETEIVATCLSSLSHAKCPNTTIRESVTLLKRVLRKERPIGLVLDMKSRHVPKRIWALIVNELNAAGVRVEAIASFTVDEIRDISHFCHEPVSEIIYFHTAGDMQLACHKGGIFYGDVVFINGGSFLYEAPTVNIAYLQNLVFGEFDEDRVLDHYALLPFAARTDNKSCSTLCAYKQKFDLKIGLYVQEFGIDEAALNVLVQFVNENPDLIEHGFCWGGVNGVTVQGIRPNRWTATDGLTNQRYAGASWDLSLSVEDVVVPRRRV